MSDWIRRALTSGTIALLALATAPLLAQDGDDTVESTAPGKWVLGTTLGTGEAGGQYGAFLEKPVKFDLATPADAGGTHGTRDGGA